MTNPSPRPALRKAADAEIHPAAPQPARSARARTVAAAPGSGPSATPPAQPEPAAVEAAAAPSGTPTGAPPAKPGGPTKPAKSAKPEKRKFSGSTSDHLRVPDLAEVAGTPRSALDHLFAGEAASSQQAAKAGKHKGKHDGRAKGDGKPQGKGKGGATGTGAVAAPKPVDLMSGKPVDLCATVPKALRTATRDAAKAMGLDVDTVVTDLLHAWLTDRR